MKIDKQKLILHLQHRIHELEKKMQCAKQDDDQQAHYEYCLMQNIFRLVLEETLKGDFDFVESESL